MGITQVHCYLTNCKHNSAEADSNYGLCLSMNIILEDGFPKNTLSCDSYEKKEKRYDNGE